MEIGSSDRCVTTAADDVWVDGNIITAENNEGAQRFGQVMIKELNG